MKTTIFYKVSFIFILITNDIFLQNGYFGDDVEDMVGPKSKMRNQEDRIEIPKESR